MVAEVEQEAARVGTLGEDDDSRVGVGDCTRDVVAAGEAVDVGPEAEALDLAGDEGAEGAGRERLRLRSGGRYVSRGEDRLDEFVYVVGELEDVAVVFAPGEDGIGEREAAVPDREPVPDYEQCDEIEA